MSERERPEFRRRHIVIDYPCGELLFTVTASKGASGRWLEIFVDGGGKAGSAAAIAAKDGAVLASLAMQAGFTPEQLLHSMEQKRDGSPAGPIGAALALLVEEGAMS